MRKGRMIVVLAAMGLLGAAVAVPQDKGGEQDLEQRVRDLERQVRAQATVIQKQEGLITDFEGRLKVVETWMQGLPAKAAAMASSLQSARDQGFVPAGANPRSREILLDALAEFSRDLGKGVPAPPPPEPEGRRRHHRRR